MAELQVPTFRSSLFEKDVAGRLLSEEASTLGFRDVGRLYDDAADVGIAIEREEHRRGRVVRFCLSEVKRDADRDVMWWEFVPCPESLRAVPALSGWRVRIFND